MTDFITEQSPLEHARARKFTPRGSRDDNPGAGVSTLVDDCTGDWSWKPLRDTALGPNLVTFRGNNPGAAESCGRTTYHVR